jgi:hypothetical protein
VKLPELMRAVHDVAQTGGTAAQCEGLAREAIRLADMVGWSNGPIDPAGSLLERLAALQSDLMERFSRANDPGIAMLNDALTQLGAAIARHDDDLEGAAEGDAGEDIIE